MSKIIIIIPKDELTEPQKEQIAKRIAAPEHKDDKGPPTCWHIYVRGLYAALEESSNEIIGVIEASGPPEAVVPGWWIDSCYRGQGMGNLLVDSLANYLQLQGYFGVGPIEIQTNSPEEEKASRKLAIRFRSHFSNPA